MNELKEQEYKKGLDVSLWKRLYEYTKPYKKYMLGLVAVMIMVGGIDAIFPMMNKFAIDNYIVTGNLDNLWLFIAGYMGLVAFQAVNVWLLITLAAKVNMGINYDIRKAGFKRLQELSYSYYDKTATGWIIARMTSDVMKIGDTIAWGLVDFVWGVTMMIAVVGFMMYLNWKMALVTLAVVPFLVIASSYFQQKMLKTHRSVRKTNSKITGAFNEGIMGARTTKTLVREDENMEEFETLTSKMKYSSVRAAIFSSLYLPIVILLGSVGTALAIWYGGKGVMLEVVSYGTLVTFIAYTVQFFEPVRELARIFAEFQAAQASAERIINMIDTEPEIKDSEEVINKYGDYTNPNKEAWPNMHGDIEFCNVTFEYADGERVLEDFNLNVKEGETIALVGETGSGKSTIVNLACRFYEPTKGEILIDGVDYRHRPQIWLHENLGYVLQSPHLFSGTIKENIMYGKPSASEIDVIRASKLVNAHEFIMKLENGYDTEVGEGGNRLSTGQKQLISFARAVLSNPKMFILDEATSSIDTETERMIQDAINKVLKGRTSFIIAHRLSTIVSADRILVIKKGKIAEEGNHAELMKKQGYYHKLYTNQFMEEKEHVMLEGN